MMNYRFRNRIREFRLMAGLSQEDLAKKVGVSRNSISMFEKQVIQPRVVTAYLIAWALSCVSVDSLFKFEIVDGEIFYG